MPGVYTRDSAVNLYPDAFLPGSETHTQLQIYNCLVFAVDGKILYYYLYPTAILYITACN